MNGGFMNDFSSQKISCTYNKSGPGFPKSIFQGIFISVHGLLWSASVTGFVNVGQFSHMRTFCMLRCYLEQEKESKYKMKILHYELRSVCDA